MAWRSPVDSHTHTQQGHGHPAPRPVAATTELARWDLPDVLSSSREKKMSLEFSQSSQHNIYPTHDIDNPSYTLTPDTVDTQDNQSPYDMFPPPPFQQQRQYRSNPPNYDPLYPTNTFQDSMQPFPAQNNNPYDMMSSYNGGKVSPLSAPDPNPGLHQNSGYAPPTPKDYAPPGYSEMSDRRLPNISGNNGYSTDLMGDYNMGNMDSNNGFRPPSLPQFNERLPHFSADGRSYSSSQSMVASHGPTGGTAPDILRGIAPHATHSFREGGIPGYDDIPHYMGSNPHQDLSDRKSVV